MSDPEAKIFAIAAAFVFGWAAFAAWLDHLN